MVSLFFKNRTRDLVVVRVVVTYGSAKFARRFTTEAFDGGQFSPDTLFYRPKCLKLGIEGGVLESVILNPRQFL